jgi:N-acetylmuramoyl-L-alanine amidase
LAENAPVRFLVLIFLVLLSGCGTSRLPVYTILPVVQHPSPNFGPRRPNFVVLHHTGSGYAERALNTLTDPKREVSAHYLVARDGTIFYLVDELARAWHAGDSWWAGVRDLNSASIGIEIDNDGEEPYREEQVQALLRLLADLKQRWGIPAANFLGHGDVAPGRKTDPGILFPWRRLADAGFGVWCEPPYPPATQDTASLLGAFGYDVSRLDAAVGAFKRRFVPAGDERSMSEDDRARLECLMRRRLEG